MSLLNGLGAFGASLSALGSNALKDLATQEETPIRRPLLNRAPIAMAAESTPTVAATSGGPRMPAGKNPYGDDPHAAALWLAERSIVGPESGGKADAQNPISSAGGLYQIINSTWDQQMSKLGLPVATSDAERKAQKYQPELNTRVMRALNTQAAAALDSAGLPVTVQTLQAAHRLGPAGAARAIKAAMTDPDAPLVGNGLSADAVRGNGDVANLMVSQFLAHPYGTRAGST